MASVPRLWISFAMFALIGLFTFNLRVALPLLVTDRCTALKSRSPCSIATLSVGAVVGTLVVAQRRLVELRHAIRGSFRPLGCAMLLLSFMPSVARGSAGGVFSGRDEYRVHDRVHTIAQVGTRSDMHGRVLALQTALIGGTALVGGPNRRSARRSGGWTCADRERKPRVFNGGRPWRARSKALFAQRLGGILTPVAKKDRDRLRRSAICRE